MFEMQNQFSATFNLGVSIIIIVKRIYSLLYAIQRDTEEMHFVVILCHDVILDVLQCGKRKQLTLLEAVGRRFHRVIDGNFVESPFLVLELYFGLIFKLREIHRVGVIGYYCSWLECTLAVPWHFSRPISSLAVPSNF